MWDAVIAGLEPGFRAITYDIRGHGQSSVPPAPYAMGALIGDLEKLLDHLNVRDAIVVGLSMGGLIAQGLAVKRLDMVRGLVLANTAAKIGHPEKWAPQIAHLENVGLHGIADDLISVWFSKHASEGLKNTWRDRLLAMDLQGYLGCCHAISGTDFYTPTSGLGLPTLGISSYNDKITPPDLTRETVDLIRGARFTILPRVGHLSALEDPAGFRDLLATFLAETGHSRAREM